MKFKIRREIKIGLFGILMLFVVYWGISFLKGIDILRRNNTYYAYYSESNNIEVSSPILINGIKIGTVTAVGIGNVHDSVKVTLTVATKYKIPDNSAALITNKSLLGGKAIVIKVGTSTTPLEDDGVLKGIVDNNMSEQINDVKEQLTITVSKLNTTLDGLNKVLSDENIGNIGATIGNVKSATGNLNMIIESQATKISEIVTNLNTLSKSLEQSAPDIKIVTANLARITDSLRTSLPPMASKLDETVGQLNKALTGINNASGSAGKLIYDPALYNNLEKATNNLNLLVIDLKNNPGKYVQFSVFGKKDKTNKK